jgi:hypothetical protein
VYTGCVCSFKSASYDILSVSMLDSSVLHCYDRSTQTHLKMLQPYQTSATSCTTSRALGLRRVPASERLYLSGRQNNFPRRLHVDPITLART